MTYHFYIVEGTTEAKVFVNTLDMTAEAKIVGGGKYETVKLEVDADGRARTTDDFYGIQSQNPALEARIHDAIYNMPRHQRDWFRKASL